MYARILKLFLGPILAHVGWTHLEPIRYYLETIRKRKQACCGPNQSMPRLGRIILGPALTHLNWTHLETIQKYMETTQANCRPNLLRGLNQSSWDCSNPRAPGLNSSGNSSGLSGNYPETQTSKQAVTHMDLSKTHPELSRNYQEMQCKQVVAPTKLCRGLDKSSWDLF